MTAAHAGVYTLTVNAGNQSFHTEFNLTVLTGTTSSGTGEPLHFLLLFLFVFSISPLPTSSIRGSYRLDELNVTESESWKFPFVVTPSLIQFGF